LTPGSGFPRKGLTLPGAFFVPHDTLNVSTSETLTRDRLTIQQAAQTLNIGRKTIYRWIDKGLLSREKEGKNAYVSLAEVRALCVRGDTLNVSGNVTDTQQGTQVDTQDTQQDTHRGGNTAMVDVSYLEGLLVRLGQLEAEKRYLLEYKAGIEAKDKELDQARAAISKAKGELQKMAELKQVAERDRAELEELRRENERLSLPFWRRWLKR
jgi:excisionase family DNA binding protein